MEFSKQDFYCYCGQYVLGEKLREHFTVCPERSNSHVYSLITELLQKVTDAKFCFFLIEELSHEQGRIQEFCSQLTNPQEPPPAVPVPDASPVVQSIAELPRKVEVTSQPEAEDKVKVEDVSQLKTEDEGQPKARKLRYRIVKIHRTTCALCEVETGQPLPCGHCFCEDHSSPEGCTLCCSACGSKDDTVTLSCYHCLCRQHLLEEFENTFNTEGRIECLICKQTIPEPEIRAIVGDEKVDSALLQFAKAQGIVNCVECKTPVFIEPAAVDYKIKDSKGRQYSVRAAECYAKYRFTCAVCKVSQCGHCAVSPYHEGLTCAEQEMEKCRYCEVLPSVASDCCESAECTQQLALSCRRVLTCGHRCFGVCGEEACPRCLADTCSLPGQPSGLDTCVICGTEHLLSRPVVLLACQHLLHFSCLREVLTRRWTTNRITFEFARCPLCKQWAFPVTHQELSTVVQTYSDLYAYIVEKGANRLRMEPEENKRVSDPRDAYYNQPEKYIMDRFCYYECYKCKGVYFGGKKECEVGDVPPQAAEEYLCPECVPVNLGFTPGVKNCPIHGTDFIEYKCRFCCTIAVYYCWGTTHFCESCHKRHNAGEHMTDKKSYQLPKCSGPLTCPLRISHPPNGKECVLGCRLCREERGRSG